MIRMLFSSVLVVHGIIHLLGFAKAWDLGPRESFTGKTSFPLGENASRFTGILWLLTCILMLTAAAAYYTKKDWFWILATVAVVISEALIIVYWHDAKWGTVVNIIVLVAVVLSAARVSFNKMTRLEVQALTSTASGKQKVIDNEGIADLPPIVQTWLNKSHLIGKEIPSSVHIVQEGSMRTDANSNWMAFDADQYFTINPPGFVWIANIHTAAFIDIAGRDKYQNGTGNMLIKAACLVPIANSSGQEIDQGTAVRYLAEIIWFPHAAVSDYLKWEQVDMHHARVTMNYRDVSASGIYTFNDNGLPVAFEAQRYGDFKGKYSKETWSVATTGYGYFNGVPIGNQSEVTWKLQDGVFKWLRLAITHIEYR
jgi:hypothetical protein